MKQIKKLILQSIEGKLKLAQDPNALVKIDVAGRLLVETLKRGHKILIAGNGGSAADSQHFAAELAGKFIYKRKGLAAIALTANTSIITAVGNDFGYEHVFSRQIEGLGSLGDIFIGISTSGNSKNLVIALQMARRQGLKTIGLLGSNGGEMSQHCDLSIVAPSNNTQVIQECHILIIHILCSLVDEDFRSS